MNLHLLINISSDTENLYGVQFYTSFFKGVAECDVTLFHIVKATGNYTSSSLLESWENPEGDLEAKLSPSARQALSKARATLGSSGSAPEKMQTKTIQEKYGKVKDILSEGSQGLYDAMILGRRATYTLQWMFDRPGEELPQALIQDGSLTCPLWICSEPEIGRKNVLLCVDGSESSKRAADHVGYILSKAKEHSVTVFHVTTTRTSNITEILATTTQILLSHKIDESRITSKRGWGLSVPGAILGEKNQGQYAAVAVGLKGLSGGFFENFGMQSGTVATLIKKIEKAALWCCP